MDEFIYVTIWVNTIQVNVDISLNMPYFAKLVMNLINTVADAHDIKLESPDDLLHVFERGIEEPDIEFVNLYNRLRSSIEFFKNIKGDITDESLKSDLAKRVRNKNLAPDFMEKQERIIDYITDQFVPSSLPSNVRFSIAKLILLLYIDLSYEDIINPLKIMVNRMENGADPKQYANSKPFHLRFWDVGDYYDFYVDHSLDLKIANNIGLKKVDRIYTDYVTSLPYETIRSLAGYTNRDYKDVNALLRKGHLYGSPDDEWLDKIKKDIENIDKAFLNAPPLQETLTLYRGQKRKISDAKAYSSTTTDMAITLDDDFLNLRDRCCLYVITAVPGSKILPVMTISVVEQENEILLDRNAKYIITNIEYKEYNRVRDTSSGSLKFETRRIRTIYVTYMPGDSQIIPPPSYVKPEDEYSSDGDE